MPTVCILVQGASNYYAVGVEAAKSVLELSDLDVYVVCDDPVKFPVASNRRLRVRSLASPVGHRSRRFLAKFNALQMCLDETDSEYIIQLDADAMFVRPLSGSQLIELLDSFSFAMVEQTTIINSDMTRKDFLDHYRDHSLAFLSPNEKPPSQEEFRFFNSGFVIGRASAFRELLEFANSIDSSSQKHQIGEHMIADQDYFQYWVNNRKVGSCRELSWEWNHCQYWDEGFPRAEAIVRHYSNFCLGPEESTPMSMRRARREALKLLPVHSQARAWSQRLKQKVVGFVG